MALRIEPTTGEVVAAIPLWARPWDVAVGEGAVWLVGPAADPEEGPGIVWRIDPGTNDVVGTVELPGAVGGYPTIATGAGGVWVESVPLFRIDPATNRIAATFRPGGVIHGVAVGGGSVWTVNHEGGFVLRIDPATNQEIGRISILDTCSCSVAVGTGGVWAS